MLELATDRHVPIPIYFKSVYPNIDISYKTLKPKKCYYTKLTDVKLAV